MSMNRAGLARTQAYAEALAKACKQLLAQDLRHEWEANESRVSAEMPFGTLTASIEQDSLDVTDDQAFFEWLRERYPQNVEVVLRVPNTEWLTKLRGQLLAKLLDEDDPLTDCPPGTKIKDGGAFAYASLRLNSAVKAHLERQAVAILSESDELPTLPQLFQVKGS